MKKAIELVMFDLDGTLANTAQDLTDAVNHTRACFNLSPLPKTLVTAHVGRPGDGVVLTSLESPSGSRMHAKALNGGQSDATLSTEEAQAVEMALTGSPPLDRSGVRQAARPGS
jgi:phosphoglycolate phosphatase-like HAD superfamily hydrolase